jgi:hypothetical protein
VKAKPFGGVQSYLVLESRAGATLEVYLFRHSGGLEADNGDGVFGGSVLMVLVLVLVLVQTDYCGRSKAEVVGRWCETT